MRWKPVLCALAAIGLAAPGLGQGNDPLEAARDALRRGDGIAGEALLREALHKGMPARAVSALMGEAELLQGDLPEARRWLRPEDFSSSERGHGFRMLGRLEMAEGNLTKAGEAFDNAFLATPRDAQLWVDIGRLRYLAGEQFQAVDASRQALALAPNDPAALKFRGQLVRDSQGLAASLPIFAAALKQAPDDLGILGEYAATLGEIGRAKDMLTVTRRMIGIDPRDPRAFYLQAVLAARAGKDDLARRLLWRTGDAYRKTPAAMLLTGVLELRSGNMETAAEPLEALWRMQPGNRRAALLVARMLLMDGREAELVDRFAALAEREDASPYLQELVGRACEALGRRNDAAIFLDRAAYGRDNALALLPDPAPVGVLEARWRDDPGKPQRILPFVRQLLALGRHEDAGAIADELRRSFPGSSDVLLLAGDVALAGGNASSALDRYREVARVRTSPALLDRMVAAELRLGRPRAAETLLASYFAEHPMDGSVAARLARFALDRRDWRRARAFAGHARKQGGGERNPRLIALMASAAIGMGDGRRAVAEARSAYRLQPHNGDIAQVYGLALKAAGRERSSANMLAKAERLRGAGGSGVAVASAVLP